MGEVFHAVVQGFCKCLDERTASRGAGLIELNAVHGLVLDLDAFHILAADVQDAVHIRLEKCGRIVVGDGLYLAFVQHERGFDERLAVAGGAGVYDLHIPRELFVDLFDGADGRAQRVAVVIMVEGIEEGSVLADQSRLGGGGAGVDAEEGLSPVGGQILHRHLVFRVAGDEFLIFCVGREERIETFHLNLHFHFLFQTVLQLAKGHNRFFL